MTIQMMAVPAVRMADGPLGAEDFLVLRQAGRLRRPVHRAAKVAYSSAGTTLVLAAFVGLGWVVSLLFGGSILGLAMGMGMALIGGIEWVGAGRLRRGDEQAVRLLAVNQLAFLAIIWVYCAVSILQIAGTPPAMDSSLGALRQAGMNGYASLLENVTRWGGYILYGLAAMLAVAFQGGMAVYYWTRGRGVRRFNAETPAWARRVMEEVG